MAEFEHTEVRATTIATTCLAFLAVVLRFVARYMTVGTKFAIDDWIIVLAMISTIGSMVVALAMVHGGIGRNMSDLSSAETVHLFKTVLVYEFVYLLNLTLIKLSILYMYKRLFPTRMVRISCRVLGGVTIAWALASAIVALVQCTPLKKMWAPETEGTCLSLFGIYLGNAIPNILTDIAMLALPITQLWRLQVRLWQKTVLIGMFLLGSFVVFISIYRMVLLLQIDQVNTSRTLEPALTWAQVEMSTAVISACLPTLRPVFLSFCSLIGLSQVVSTLGDRSRGITLPDRPKQKTADASPRSSRAIIDPEDRDWMQIGQATKGLDDFGCSCGGGTAPCRDCGSTGGGNQVNIEITELHQDNDRQRTNTSEDRSHKAHEMQTFSVV